MELPFLPTWREEGRRAEFRRGVKEIGVELGSWGWYTCDYEIDQVASMTVNNRVIAHVFGETRRQADHVMTPSYWSELDSYHLINFFSMYAAGHLMIDPDADPDELLRESALLMVGNDRPEELCRLISILELIRDSRSGNCWENYWSSEPAYNLVHLDYTPILPRAEKAITDLEYLIKQPEPDDGVAFPITRKSLYRLMMPHLCQIRQYAKFRIDLDAIKAMSEAGADKTVLQEKIDALDFEIPEYNCTIGLWGQNEARIAHHLITEFCGEKGLTAPGDLIIGADSHTCTYGALGAFSTGVGSTDMAAGMAMGENWFKVPSAIQVELKGKLQPFVSGKDVILHLIGLIGVDGALYQSLEFTGEGVAALSMDDRFTIANMAIEAGAKNGIFPVDEKTLEYIKGRVNRPYQVFAADPDAEYTRKVVIDLDKLEPTVSLPHLPSNTRTISQVKGMDIQQVVIGSCTNGRISDLRAAAEILKGRRVAAGVRCIVIPATQEIYLQAMHEGLMDIFIHSGCAVSTPTCGPCLGGHMGVMCEGERAVTTTNRNFVGRMGHVKSEVVLASPAVAAASAVAGCLADPAEMGKGA